MGKVLVLRTCNAEMKSHGGFLWPESGPVEALDWEPTYQCGHGLHGLQWGEGKGHYLAWDNDARWLVVEVDEADLLHGAGQLTDKCKFRRGVVVGIPKTREAATAYIAEHGGAGRAIAGIALTGGDKSTLTGGYHSTLIGGHHSTLTGGYGSTLTGGDYSTLTGGHRSTLIGGYHSTLIGGHHSTLIGGDESTLSVRWYDGLRWRLAVGYVGENGIEPNVAYRVENGQFVRVEAHQ